MAFLQAFRNHSREFEFISEFESLYNLRNSSNATFPEDEEPNNDNNYLRLFEHGYSQDEIVTEFMKKSCGCAKACPNLFSREVIEDFRNNIQETTTVQKDLLILGILAQIRLPKYLENEKSEATSTSYFKYHIFGKNICRTMFTFMFDIGVEKLYSIIRQYDEYGITPRIHGNTKRLPKNAFSMETNLNVRTFIENYAEENAISLPGRIPGLQETDKVCLLPSSESKKDIWHLYEACCRKASLISVGYVTFCKLWNQLCPWIVVSKPMTDLCWKCQSNNNLIYRCTNQEENLKMEKLSEQMEHICTAKSERQYYKDQCSESLKTIIENSIDIMEKATPCSLNGTMHYSWDYAQQVHYPCDPQQPGPIYFKTPRKCSIFGVCIDALPMQYNYLIDEHVSVGKGANATISYVHDFLENHGAGETHGLFHADNCSGQNKNNHFIHYMLWRVMNNLHHYIEYSFLIAGHTKFSCDQCFGIMKTKMKKSPIWTLYDVANTVEQSSIVNYAKLVGSHDGNIFVQAYNWSDFLITYFKKLKNIKKYHHFEFFKDKPGVVVCREFKNSAKIEVNLLKDEDKRPINMYPDIINPIGMSLDRQQYLYSDIREFCKYGTEDVVAPKP